MGKFEDRREEEEEEEEEEENRSVGVILQSKYSIIYLNE